MENNNNYILELKMLIKVTGHNGGLTVTETIKKIVISNTVNLGQLWYKLKLGGGLINLLSTVYAEMYAHVLHTVNILYICSYAHITATLLLETQTDKNHNELQLHICRPFLCYTQKNIIHKTERRGWTHTIATHMTKNRM